MLLDSLSSQPEAFLASPTNHGAVLQYFEQCSGKENEPLILEELLSKGSKAPGFKDLKVSLLESLLSRLFFEDSPPRLCEVLLNELDELSLEQLSSFSTSVLDVLKDPARDLRESCVSIVGKLLFLLGERNEGKASSSLLNSLCSSPWRPSNAIILASIFRSTQLKGEALLLILDKITDLMSSLTPDLIPPLVHQVLHLSVSSADSNAPLLKALQSFYAKALRRASNDSQRSVIYHSRDTTLLHILQSIKIGHSISSHLLKLLRSLDYRCLHDPFILFNCLSITSVKHIRKQALDGLKSLILKHVEFNTKAFKIGWLIELGDKFPGTFQKTALDLISTSIRFGGWSFIQNGVIELGLSLLDVSSPRNDVHLSQVWNLATAILSQTLHDSPDSAEMYIKEISSRVIASSESHSQFIKSFRRIIRENLNVFLQNTTFLTSLLDQVPHMSVHPARRVISAFQPLFKRSRLLRDQLIMIFRKALFSSSEDSRQIAILGVLELIKCFKLSVSSQNSMSVLSQSSGSLMTQSVVDIQSGVQLSNESICIELLSVLKRGFTQQATIRKTIYKELCQVLMLNPEICNSCLDILYQQSVVNKIKSSVDVGKLITNDRVYEPAGWFLHCTQYTITRGQELYKSSEDVVASLDKLSKMLHDLTENYSKIDDTDLQIESGQSFLHAETLQNIYESLIEFCVMNGETSEYKLSKIKSLFQKYKSIEVPVEEPLAKMKKTGKEGPKSSPGHTLSISSKAIIILIRISLSSDDQGELSDGAFISWVLKLAKAKIQELESSLKISGEGGGDLIHSELRVFGSSLLEHCLNSSSLQNEHVLLISGCLHQVLLLIKKHYPESMEKFITQLDNVDGSESLPSCIVSLCKKFMERTDGYLEQLKADDSISDLPQIIAHYLKVIWLLAEECSGDHLNELRFIGDWIKHLVKGSTCPLFLQKVVFELLLSLELKMRSSPRVLVDIAREVHLKVGDTKRESVVEPGKYMAIDKDSAEEICAILSSHLGQALDSADLLLNNLSQICSWNTHEKMDHESALSLEASLCHFLAHLSNASIELSQTAFPNCSSVQDSIFKLFTRLYLTLGKMSKYFCTGFTGKKNASILSSRFDKLVEIISDQLTKNIYTLINFAEDLCQTNLQNASTRSKSRATKDSKIIPQLIFSIAEFEKNLMKLNPRSQVDLTQYCKVSTSRDFRFNIEALEKSETTQ